MKKNMIIYIVFTVVLITFIVWKYQSSQKKTSELIEKLNNEYPELTLNLFLNNKVIDTYYPADWRGEEFSQYITLDDGRKFQLSTGECINVKNVYFGLEVKKNAKLIKNMNSDTIRIINNTGEFIFIYIQY